MVNRILSRQYGTRSSDEVRVALLAAALRFVRRARSLAGVERIALVGSLATAKRFPKDVDVLVTVADNMDLRELAHLGRQLTGGAQVLNGGADVFLASPDGTYLGRTCPWRECWPGQRVRCGAGYESGRPFLRDDLPAVRLPAGLIAAPPVELWPDVRARVPVPPDVEAVLLAPLSADRAAASRAAI
jgi:predicted nucleotidyltransferase